MHLVYEYTDTEKTTRKKRPPGKISFLFKIIMYNQSEAIKVSTFTESLSVTSVMNRYHTSVNEQSEQKS